MKLNQIKGSSRASHIAIPEEDEYNEQDDPEIYFKEEHVFENGAVYRGQWKKD
jgi:hypothetical protein